MNKFKKGLNFMMKWITIVWNMVVVFLSGAFAFYALGNYLGERDIAGMLWLIGITVFINTLNLWNRILVRIK